MITLAKALKHKNRLAAKLAQVQADIAEHNSILVGNPREVDIQAAMELCDRVTAKLVELKTAVSLANAPIQAKILEMAEARGKIAFLRRLDTTHGKKARQGWGEEAPQECEAALRKADVDRLVADAQRRIDQLQEDIEAHNQRTEINVDVPEELLV